ncbi:MAG: hypothetical protein HY788_11490 [Deltaproteobacteria bacterium]|nr:hypothetical protein [Deltaproteobacteria bacterium]
MEQVFPGALRIRGEGDPEVCDDCIWFEFDEESRGCGNRYHLCCFLLLEERFSPQEHLQSGNSGLMK